LLISPKCNKTFMVVKFYDLMFCLKRIKTKTKTNDL